MRLKHVKGAEEFIAASPYALEGEGTDGKLAGNWHAFFGNSNPIHLEIGTGKGQFLLELAKAHPEINYIGVEKYSSVLIRAVQKRSSEPYDQLDNICFIRMDADFIEEIFAPDEVERIYLNFSDPWPKERHAKRRLTSRQFLAHYEKFLTKEGLVEFKTDNVRLFPFSLSEVTEAGWVLLGYTDDLHSPEKNYSVMGTDSAGETVFCQGKPEGEIFEELFTNNVMTEYEEKFVAEKVPIHKLIAVQKEV